MEIIGVILIVAGIYWYSSRSSFIAGRLWYTIMKSQDINEKAQLIAMKTGLTYYYRLRGRGLSSQQIYDLVVADVTPEEELFLNQLKIWAEEYSEEGENYTPRDVFGDYIESWGSQLEALEWGR